MARTNLFRSRTSSLKIILKVTVIIAIFEAVYYITVSDIIVNRKDDYADINASSVVLEEEYKITSKKLIMRNAEEISYKVYPQTRKLNKVRVIYDGCASTAYQPRSSSNNSIVVLTNFMLFSQKRFNLSIENASLDNELVEARVMEIVDVLYNNLQHPYIEELHVLVKDEETLEFLQRLPLKNIEKLLIKVVKDDITMKLQLMYAGNCLKNKIVAVAHQDNLFGNGWEKLQPDILQKRKLMYALTRHSMRTNCSTSKQFVCDPGYRYVGSHDVFMFHVKEAFTSDMLKPMDNITPNLNGMENVLIWMFKEKLGYTVMNPCLILYVHHQHCISIRDKARRRVNTAKTTGWASFTSKLDNL